MSLLMKILLIILAVLCLPLGLISPIFFLMAAVIIVLLIVTSKKKKDPEPQPVIVPQVTASVSNRNEHVLSFAVAGVTFKNDDGRSRQKILQEADEDSLSYYAELEEYNFKSEKAVGVLINGEMIGNIPRDTLDQYFRYEEQYEQVDIDADIYGGEDDDSGSKKNYGCKIRITYVEK